MKKEELTILDAENGHAGLFAAGVTPLRSAARHDGGSDERNYQSR